MLLLARNLQVSQGLAGNRLPAHLLDLLQVWGETAGMTSPLGSWSPNPLPQKQFMHLRGS